MCNNKPIDNFIRALKEIEQTCSVRISYVVLKLSVMVAKQLLKNLTKSKTTAEP